MSCEITRARKKRPIYQQLGDRINAPFVSQKKYFIVAVIITVTIVINELKFTSYFKILAWKMYPLSKRACLSLINFYLLLTYLVHLSFS